MLSFRGSLFHKQTSSRFFLGSTVFWLNSTLYHHLYSFLFQILLPWLCIFFWKFFFFHLWSYIQIQEALFFVDFFGDRLGHTNMNRQLFCFLILAFFLLFIFFVIPIIVRTVRPGGGQNWDFFLIFFVLLLPLPLQVLSLSYQHKTTNHWTKKGTEVAAATHRASLKIK